VALTGFFSNVAAGNRGDLKIKCQKERKNPQMDHNAKSLFLEIRLRLSEKPHQETEIWVTT
jgi:hypothetical protein